MQFTYPSRFRQVLYRSLVIGVVWTAVVYVGRLTMGQWDTAFAVLGQFISSFMLALIVGAVAKNLPWPMLQRIAALWLALLVVRGVNIALELHFFSNRGVELLRFAALAVVSNLLIAFALAWIFPAASEVSSVGRDLRNLLAQRHPVSWILRLLLADLIYVFTYFIFGGIAFIFTRPYYTDPKYGLGLKLPSSITVLFELQIFRALLYLLISLPLIAGLRTRRFKTALLIGMVLWVGGGLAPLTSAAAQIWPAALRFYHTVEILSQNFTTGVAFAYLLYASTQRTEAKTFPAVQVSTNSPAQAQ